MCFVQHFFPAQKPANSSCWQAFPSKNLFNLIGETRISSEGYLRLLASSFPKNWVIQLCVVLNLCIIDFFYSWFYLKEALAKSGAEYSCICPGFSLELSIDYPKTHTHVPLLVALPSAKEKAINLGYDRSNRSHC